MQARLVVVLLSFATGAEASDWYVGPSGDDAGPGTEDAPFATLQRAAESAVVPGDRVFVLPGRYAQVVEIRAHGAQDAPIVWNGGGGDTRAIVDGEGLDLPEGTPLVSVVGSSHVVVGGLRVEHALQGPGIFVGDSADVVVEDNETYDTYSSGIGVWGGERVAVVRNEIELACNFSCEGCGLQETLTIADTDSFEVADNRVHDTGGDGGGGGEGINVKGGATDGRIHGNVVYATYASGPWRVGIHVNPWDGDAHDIEIYANRIFDLPEAHGIVVSDEGPPGGRLERVRVFNNVAYANAFVGVLVAEWGEADLADVQVLNNTLVGNGEPIWGGGISVTNDGALDVVVRNNIASGNRSFQIASPRTPPGLLIDHNLVDGFRGKEGETRGDDAMEADPMFVDAAAGDFHLREGSLAVDAASSDGAPGDDFDGWARPVGAGWDIGAFELGAGPEPDAGAAGDGGADAGSDPGDDPGTRSAASGCGCTIAHAAPGAADGFAWIAVGACLAVAVWRCGTLRRT